MFSFLDVALPDPYIGFGLPGLSALGIALIVLGILFVLIGCVLVIAGVIFFVVKNRKKSANDTVIQEKASTDSQNLSKSETE